jgi:hypothetical protein
MTPGGLVYTPIALARITSPGQILAPVDQPVWVHGKILRYLKV